MCMIVLHASTATVTKYFDPHEIMTPVVIIFVNKWLPGHNISNHSKMTPNVKYWPQKKYMYNPSAQYDPIYLNLL